MAKLHARASGSQMKIPTQVRITRTSSVNCISQGRKPRSKKPQSEKHSPCYLRMLNQIPLRKQSCRKGLAPPFLYRLRVKREDIPHYSLFKPRVAVRVKCSFSRCTTINCTLLTSSIVRPLIFSVRLNLQYLLEQR